MKSVKHVRWIDNPTRGVMAWGTCTGCSKYLRSTFKEGFCKQCRPRSYHIECLLCSQPLNGPFAMQSGVCPSCCEIESHVPEHQRLTIFDLN